MPNLRKIATINDLVCFPLNLLETEAELSFEAIGLLVVLAAKPDGEKVTKKSLQIRQTNQTKLNRILKELGERNILVQEGQDWKYNVPFVRMPHRSVAQEQPQQQQTPQAEQKQEKPEQTTTPQEKKAPEPDFDLTKEIDDSTIARWEEHSRFGDVNIREELKKAHQYLVEHPDRRDVDKQMFIENWLENRKMELEKRR